MAGGHCISSDIDHFPHCRKSEWAELLEGKRVSKLWVGARDVVVVFFFFSPMQIVFCNFSSFLNFLINFLTAQLVEYYFPERGSNPGPGTESTES